MCCARQALRRLHASRWHVILQRWRNVRRIMPLSGPRRMGTPARRPRARGRDSRHRAPDLFRVETVSVIRRRFANGALTAAQGKQRDRRSAELPDHRLPDRPLLRRAWELRDNATACHPGHTTASTEPGVPLCPLWALDVVGERWALPSSATASARGSSARAGRDTQRGEEDRRLDALRSVRVVMACVVPTERLTSLAGCLRCAHTSCT